MKVFNQSIYLAIRVLSFFFEGFATQLDKDEGAEISRNRYGSMAKCERYYSAIKTKLLCKISGLQYYKIQNDLQDTLNLSIHATYEQSIKILD